MKMFRMSVSDLDGMSVSYLIDRLADIYMSDRKAKLSIEENESWDSLSGEVTTTYDLVSYHKDERGQ